MAKQNPIPSRCPSCLANAMQQARTTVTSVVKYESAKHTVVAENCPVFVCGDCGEQLYYSETFEIIDRQFRSNIGILLAEEIKKNRNALGLTQVELAAKIRISPESISRWEKGHIRQSRSSDLLLRLFFGLPDVRTCVHAAASDFNFGREVVHASSESSWDSESMGISILAPTLARSVWQAECINQSNAPSPKPANFDDSWPCRLAI
ncbi:MAG: helix-turn-helix domain-containing protein [Phycisphaerales bacterium]|nr:helix-turn-helix domain-containing protein [Phycisphaerales bacterium]